MPVVYSIDVPLSLIVTRCVGPVTLAEVRAHFEELARDWPPVERLDVLLDLTAQTSLPGLHDLEAVAMKIAAQIGPRQFGRCAVVTDPGTLLETMQMFEVLAGRFFDEMQLFHSELAAMAWLVPTPKISRTLTAH